jgi:AraC-like DNA-binding protein
LKECDGPMPLPVRGVLAPLAQRFSYTRRPPSADLERFVDFHWLVAWDLRGEEPHVQSTLPFPCVNIVAADDGFLVHGPVTKRYERTLRDVGYGIGTRISAGWFPGFAHMPVWPLTDGSRALDEVFGDAGAALAQAVDRAPIDEHIAAVEQFLRSRLPEPDHDAELAATIVAHMLAAPPNARVDAVADRFGLTPRGLQRLFRHYVGLTPKTVLQRARAQEAAERVAEGEDHGARLALDLGYSDQAHFINDFRAAVGRSPTRYARASTANGQGPSINPSTPSGPAPSRRGDSVKASTHSPAAADGSSSDHRPPRKGTTTSTSATPRR